MACSQRTRIVLHTLDLIAQATHASSRAVFRHAMANCPNVTHLDLQFPSIDRASVVSHECWGILEDLTTLGCFQRTSHLALRNIPKDHVADLCRRISLNMPALRCLAILVDYDCFNNDIGCDIEQLKLDIGCELPSQLELVDKHAHRRAENRDAQTTESQYSFDDQCDDDSYRDYYHEHY